MIETLEVTLRVCFPASHAFLGNLSLSQTFMPKQP